MKYILKETSSNEPYFLKESSSIELFLQDFFKDYRILQEALKKSLNFKMEGNILSKEFSDTDLFEINKISLQKLEEDRKIYLQKDIEKEINSDIMKLKDLIAIYENSTSNKEESKRKAQNFQEEFEKELNDELKEINVLLKQIKRIHLLISKNFTGFRDPSNFNIKNDFTSLKKGDILYFPYYRKANPKINLNIGLDLSTKKEYYLAKVENLDKDSSKNPSNFKVPELNIQSIFKVIENIDNNKLILKRIIMTDMGYKNTTEDIELILDNNHQYFGYYLYSDGHSKISELKETTSFKEVLKSLTNFAQNKKSYQLDPNKDRLGRYSNKDISYALYSISDNSIDFVIKDFSNYQLIEKVKINEFMSKYRSLVQNTLKTKKLNDLDYYGFLLTYKDSAFHLNYIYEILNKLKEVNINEVEFYSDGKRMESNLLIKDTTFFIIYAQASGFDNHYKYIEWKTDKDSSKNIEKATRLYNEKYEKRLKEEERKKEKEVKPEIPIEIPKEKTKEIKIPIEIPKEKTKEIKSEVKKSSKLEEKITLSLKEYKFDLKIIYINSKYIIIESFTNTGTIRDKEFNTNAEVLEYLNKKKVSNRNIELFKSTFKE